VAVLQRFRRGLMMRGCAAAAFLASPNSQQLSVSADRGQKAKIARVIGKQRGSDLRVFGGRK